MANLEIRGDRLNPGTIVLVSLPIAVGTCLAAFVQARGRPLPRFLAELPPAAAGATAGLIGAWLLFVVAAYAHARSRRLSLLGDRLEYRSAFFRRECRAADLGRVGVEVSTTPYGSLRTLVFWTRDGAKFVQLNANGWAPEDLLRLLEGMRVRNPRLKIAQDAWRIFGGSSSS